MLLGYARGSVGDMVFTRTQGQQIVKARNRNPYNPKTGRQTNQRASFVNAVKFFTRGTQNLFKFAFETKSQKESDFNAFMRYNTARSVMISKEAVGEETYPALGEFIMSQGTLTPLEVKYFEDISTHREHWEISLPQVYLSQKWSDISRDLIRTYGYQEGDIITIVRISAIGSTIENTPSINPETRGSVTWVINQSTINTKDTRTLQQAFPGIDINITSNGITIQNYNVSNCAGLAVICSRKTRRGLKVTTSRLAGNKTAKTAIQSCQSTDYKFEVQQSWGAVDLALLEGGALEGTNIGGVQFYGFIGGADSEDFTNINVSGVGDILASTPTTRKVFVKVLCDDKSKIDMDSYITVKTPSGRQEPAFLLQRVEETGVFEFEYSESAIAEEFTCYYMNEPLFTCPKPTFPEPRVPSFPYQPQHASTDVCTPYEEMTDVPTYHQGDAIAMYVSDQFTEAEILDVDYRVGVNGGQVKWTTPNVVYEPDVNLYKVIFVANAGTTGTTYNIQMNGHTILSAEVQ